MALLLRDICACVCLFVCMCVCVCGASIVAWLILHLFFFVFYELVHLLEKLSLYFIFLRCILNGDDDHDDDGKASVGFWLFFLIVLFVRWL